MEDIGLRIRQLREEKKLEQLSLSLELKVYQNTISRLENGNLKKLAPELLIDLANFFGVHIDWILTGKGEKYRMTDQMQKEVIEEADDLIKNKSKEELILEVQLRKQQMEDLKKMMKDFMDKI